MPDLRPVDYQEAVVTFLAGMNAYWWILAVMLLQVQLQPAAGSMHVDVGLHVRIPFAEYQQHGFVDIVDYITLNVPPVADSNVPLQKWSHEVRQSYDYF